VVPVTQDPIVVGTPPREEDPQLVIEKEPQSKRETKSLVAISATLLCIGITCNYRFI
jgi:hypothetical protein